MSESVTPFIVQEVSEKRIPIILCGNKVDQRQGCLEEGRRAVSAEDGEKMAREYRYRQLYVHTAQHPAPSLFLYLLLYLPVCLQRTAL